MKNTIVGGTFAVLLLACASGCTKHSTVSAATANARAEGVLLPPSRIPYDFMWRQRITASWPTGTQSFEAVLQKRNGELLMLGLSPMGLPGFTLTLQEDGAIRVENRMGRELPFEPAYVLADVQRVFFPWFDAPAQEGERSTTVAGQVLREVYAAGVLKSREFRHPDAADAGSVRIDYSGMVAGQDAAQHVSLDNAWYRYRLEIETFEQSRL